MHFGLSMGMRPHGQGALGGFSPLDFNPQLWLNADSGVKAVGSREFFPNDKSSFTKASFAGANFGVGDFSLNCMVYRLGSGNQVILSKYQDANNYWKFEFTAGNVVHFIAVVGGATKIEITGTTTLAAIGWHSVSVVVDRDSSANTKIYLDAVNNTSGSPAVSTDNIDNTGAVWLAQDGNSSLYWHGRLSTVGLWKEALSSSLVTILHNGGQGTLHAELSAALLTNVQAYYDLNEVTAEVLSTAGPFTPANADDDNGTNDLTPSFGELFQNTGFDSDTIWTKGAGWTIAAGVATAATPNSVITQPFALRRFAFYVCTYTLSSYTAGNFTIRFQDAASGRVINSGPHTANGTYSLFAVMNHNLLFEVAGVHGNSSAVGNIDNCSLKLAEIASSAGPRDSSVNTDPIVEWCGRETIGHILTQVPVFRRPTLRTAGLNSLRSVECGSGSTNLALYKYGSIFTGQSGTLAFVVKTPTVITATRQLLVCGSIGVSTSRIIIDSRNPGKFGYQFLNGAISNTLNFDTQLVAATPYVLTISSDGSTITAQINGVAATVVVAGGANDGGWFGDLTLQDIASIGVGMVGGSLPYSNGWLDGHIRDVFYTTPKLSDDDLLALTEYLAESAGIAL